MKGTTFEQIDVRITRWMGFSGVRLLRISLGIIFFWFGLLKYFEGLSPAEALATQTIDILTFGVIGPTTVRYGLASWEVLIGIGLIFKIFLRETLLLMFLQMIGTLTPIFLLPDQVFTHFPYGLTLEGQYIFKNLVVISSGIVIGATVRGGGIITEKPDSLGIDKTSRIADN